MLNASGVWFFDKSLLLNINSLENSMKIEIQALHFRLTDALRQHTERRVRFALTCGSDRIQKIIMRLSDINGPRGGADKRCKVHVVLAGLPDVIVEDTEPNLYVAINRAVERAAGTLMRKIHRNHTRLKHSNQPILDME